MQHHADILGHGERAEQRAALEERILGRAHAVAKAAGGFLGLAAVSKEEEAMLAELKRAFGD